MARWSRALLALVLGVLLPGTGCSREETKYPELRARGGEVTVDIAGIAAGSGSFHTYRAGAGKRVDFFVYRDGAGAPHAVLDACRTCYRWRKGYLLSRGEVVCIKCDMVFKLDDLEKGTGSCVPIHVDAERRGETLVIPAAKLEAGARYF